MGFVLDEIAKQSGSMLNRSGEIQNLKRQRFQLTHSVDQISFDKQKSRKRHQHSSCSVLAPLSGELPKAEGAAQAVYFAMNISRELGDTCS